MGCCGCGRSVLRHVRLMQSDALLAVFSKLAASDASSSHASTSSSSASASTAAASSSSIPAKVCRPRLCPFGMKSRLYKRRPRDRRESCVSLRMFITRMTGLSHSLSQRQGLFIRLLETKEMLPGCAIEERSPSHPSEAGRMLLFALHGKYQMLRLKSTSKDDCCAYGTAWPLITLQYTECRLGLKHFRV